jgi:hypothetical protein
VNMKSDKSGSGRSDAGPPFDDQQAHLLSILSRRVGEPVTYEELRQAGIEFPAGLVAELELAGVEVDRCRVPVPGGRPIRAVRLPSAIEDFPQAAAESSRPSPAPAPASSPARAQEPTSRLAPRPSPASSPAGGPEPTSSPVSGPGPDVGLFPPPQPASSRSPLSPPTAQELPQRELPPSGSAASGPGWGPVRVYRSSPRPRWARRARDRDGAPIGSEM